MTVPRLLAGLAVVVVLAGCGAHAPSSHPAPSAAARASAGVPTPSVGVIEGWSKALRAGRVADAARYFRVPSVFFTGSGPPIELRSQAEVRAVNVALPCGATFLSARIEGRYVNALFRLGDRPGPGGGGGCGSGTGQTARTDFLIRNGRIEAWLRAPDEPGDNGSSRTPPPSSPPTPRPTETAPNPMV